MKIYVNKLDLLVVLLWIAIFPFYLPYMELYYIYQFIIALIILAYTVYEIKKVPGYIILLMYPMAIIISCIVNRSTILYTQVIRGITSALIIVDIFALLHKYIRHKGTEKLFKLFYNLSLLYSIINVIWILGLIVMGKLENAIQDEFLFSKGKFTTAYIFVFYLMFFCITWSGNKFFSKKCKKTIFIILAIGYIGICGLIQTTTGIIAITLFLLFMLIPGKTLKLINNPTLLIGLLIGSLAIVFSLSIILSLSFVQNLIVIVLHKDLSLTGRMQLYELLYPLMMKSGLWGGGFGSYVAAKLAYHGWYNAQNGLAEIILTYGFIGAGTFLLTAFTASLNKHSYFEPLNAAILVFIVVAIIEIPFNMSFIFLLSLLMLSNSNKVEKDSKSPQILTS